MVVRCCCMAVLVMFALIGFFAVALFCLSIYIGLSSFAVVQLRHGDVLGNTRRLQEELRRYLNTDTPHMAFLVDSNERIDVNLSAVLADINSHGQGKKELDEECKTKAAKAYAIWKAALGKMDVDTLLVMPHNCVCGGWRAMCLNVGGSRIMLVVAFPTDTNANLALIVHLTWYVRIFGFGPSSLAGNRTIDEL